MSRYIGSLLLGFHVILPSSVESLFHQIVERIAQTTDRLRINHTNRVMEKNTVLTPSSALTTIPLPFPSRTDVQALPARSKAVDI